MKSRVPFLLGLLLGPIGALVSRVTYGSEYNGDALKGMGAFVCVVLFCRIVVLEVSRSTARGKQSNVAVMSERYRSSAREMIHEREPQKPAAKTLQIKESAVSANVDKGISVSNIPSERIRQVKVPDAWDKETLEKMAHIKDLILKFREKHQGRLPPLLSSLSEVCGKNGYVPRRDAWGRRFAYESQNGDFAIVSAGPDRKFDTADDVDMIVKKDK